MESDWVKPEAEDCQPVSKEAQCPEPPSENLEAATEPAATQDNTPVRNESDESLVDLTEFIVETVAEPQQGHPASPIVEEPPETHTIQVDVSGYAPSEITVETDKAKLKVSACHSEEKDGGSEEYSFSRSFAVPEGADVERMIWEVDQEGILTISLPPLQEHIVKEL